MGGIPACATGTSGATGTEKPPEARDSVRWLAVPLAGGGTLRAAVARPAGQGPFPTVLLLHGTHGFAMEYVQLARDLAARGVLAVAACWFREGTGPGARFITPIACPGAPPVSLASSPDARRAVKALVAAVESLPEADGAGVALFGHSRGGGVALRYAMDSPGTPALVLNSAGYPPEVLARSAALEVPLLLLHGQTDRAEGGGSPMTTVDRARAFEAGVRASGGHVSARYFAGGHNALFTDRAQWAASVDLIAGWVRGGARERGGSLSADAQNPPGREPARLPLELLPDTLAICRLAPDAPLPPWATEPSGFLTVSRTADELSIMTLQRAVPAGVRCERDYQALRVRGPLSPNLVGILLSLLEPLADAGLSILAISTYDTDYVFVKTRHLPAALKALRAAGHQIIP